MLYGMTNSCDNGIHPLELAATEYFKEINGSLKGLEVCV